MLLLGYLDYHLLRVSGEGLITNSIWLSTPDDNLASISADAY